MRRAILILAAVFLLTAGAKAQLHSALPPVTVGNSRDRPSTPSPRALKMTSSPKAK